MKNTRRTWSDQQLIEAVITSDNLSAVASKLGFAGYGSNSSTIKKHIARLELDITHFLSKKELNARSQMLNKRKTKEQFLQEIFCFDSKSPRKNIRRNILKYSLLSYACSSCEITHWKGESLTLELDHINGINNDNRLENLRFLCPNCHSMTETYVGKNIKRKRIPHTCIDCGSEIKKDSSRCAKCAPNKRKIKINWPSTVELTNLIKQVGYAEAARQLNVSDIGLRKRVRNHPDYIRI